MRKKEGPGSSQSITGRRCRGCADLANVSVAYSCSVGSTWSTEKVLQVSARKGMGREQNGLYTKQFPHVSVSSLSSYLHQKLIEEGEGQDPTLCLHHHQSHPLPTALPPSSPSPTYSSKPVCLQAEPLRSHGDGPDFEPLPTSYNVILKLKGKEFQK